MYTLESLQQKNFKELKEIGWQLNVLPEGDRRCRRNWIKALVGVQPPLLQLLEASPGVEPVQEAIEVQVQEPIEVQVQEPIEVQVQEPIEVQAQEPIEVQVQEAIEVDQVQEPIEVDQVQELIEVQVQEPPIESKFGRIIYPKPIIKPIASVVENSPAVAEGDRFLPLVKYAAQTSPAEVELVAEAIGEVQKPLPEISPAEVELFAQAIEVQVQEPIEVQVQEPIEVQIQELIEVDQVQEPIEIQVQEPIESKLEPAVFQALTFSDALEICRLVSEALPAKTLQKLQMLRLKVLDLTARPGADCFHGHSKHKSSWINEIRSELTYLLEIRAIAFAPPLGLGRHISPGCLKRSWEIPTPPDVEPVQDAIEVQAQEAIEVQAIGPIEIQAIEPIAPAAETSPGVSEGDRPLVLTKDAAETFSGVSRKTSTARQLLEPFKSSAVILGDSPAAETEAETLESAIGLAAKNLLDAEADQNPILTNITFSPGFLARYSPPRSENIHYQTDADGQLSLLDFEVESVDEPPDPDDFETLNAFREAIALWDATHPELIEIGLDSFSEWALCPDDWYEPDTLLEPHDSHIRPPQALTEQRPPGRGDGRGGYVEFAIGMLVGRRRDRLHLGKVLAIYKSRRGIWRAKIQPLNKPNFVYFDCSTLIEQRLLYDYEMKPGGFLPSGQIFDKNRGENFQVYSRKVRAKPTTWTPGQLSQLSTFKLKQIARDMEVPSIPGSAGKRSLIRAILAEQAISQEKAAAQRENSSQTAQKQKPASVASSKKRAAALLLESQLLLFDVAV